MHTQTAILQRGQIVPNFTLPSIGGDMVKRSVYRARKHLALVLFSHADQAMQNYLLALREDYPQIRMYDGEVVAIVSDPALDAAALAMRLEVPFPLLLDREQTVIPRFLPNSAATGVFITDRYGALHTQWIIERPPFPPVAEVVDWLRVLDYQCVL